MITLPTELVEAYFRTYAGFPHKKGNGSWCGCCPSCHEGKSWGKKKRLFYVVNPGYICCHNCGKIWSPLNWMIEVSGKPIPEIMRDSESYDYCSVDLMEYEEPKRKEHPDLPDGSIKLDNNTQIRYYSNDKIVNDALKLIHDRRLDTAYNPISYYISKSDYVHRNRLCIPFKDLNGKIIFYQTRAMYQRDLDMSKYLSKMDADKTIFGIDHVDLSIPYLLVTEGPIDSCFVPNGVSMAGIVYTEKQKEQLGMFLAQEIIWILDNDFTTNDEVLKKYEELIDRGERVFIWPSEFVKFKDINEVCIEKELDVLPLKLFTTYSYTGMEAKLALKTRIAENKNKK